jgi:DNA-binding CsgD family transcriptional regulator
VDVLSSVGDELPHSAAQPVADAASISAEVLNALSTGIAVLDMRGHVVFANATAARLIRRPTVFKSSAPLPLMLCHAESNDALRKAILCACASSSVALQLRDAEGGAVISAVALPLPPSTSSSHWQKPVVLLAMNELIRSEAIPHRWLSQMFGLTRTEASVTNWLVSGRSIDEYAQHRGVSLETARSQLKTVLSKTGMSRQAQLVAALARLPVEYAAT